ncbi:hypothetical protein BO71DRAFT_249541 [Aspergillus ellipticus CBS 707.79]|uniref:Uncharacterized protein n=1 Tax=Aspergillus ellipticus CBS 707.79 TaxID=1448320 RepID=A0A319D9D6_9EURO|nr:hypothetical protein BO71DRAFT_249541 [Aspergillus ellipticus CBS 707.79]
MKRGWVGACWVPCKCLGFSLAWGGAGRGLIVCIIVVQAGRFLLYYCGVRLNDTPTEPLLSIYLLTGHCQYVYFILLYIDIMLLLYSSVHSSVLLPRLV